VDYEFEAEALADYKFAIDPNKTETEANEGLFECLEKDVTEGEEPQTKKKGIEELLPYMRPRQFARKNNMYSQRDPGVESIIKDIKHSV